MFGSEKAPAYHDTLLSTVSSDTNLRLESNGRGRKRRTFHRRISCKDQKNPALRRGCSPWPRSEDRADQSLLPVDLGAYLKRVGLVAIEGATLYV